MALHIVDHPLAVHILTLLRDKDTDPAHFRNLCEQLTYFMIVESTRELKTKDVFVETPVEGCQGIALERSLVVVPILRAGLAMLQPFLKVLPDVSVGYVGLERDETTAQARSYYLKLPELKGRDVLILDPMLATGGSAKKALEQVYGEGPASVMMVSIVAAPEGVDLLTSAFPDLPIFTASLDRALNGQRFIVPGLGDFGDRLFGT
tara:strand:- start:111 stop:728 length:618 start_codon:yes stop_codon:yes gene_type:complete